MPLIEYHCKNCGHTQERLIYSDPVPRMRCEKCAKFSYKVMSLSSSYFKGSGFHATDYPKEGK